MMNSIGQIDVPVARRAKQGGITFGAAAVAMASGLLLGIGLGFHHNATEQTAVALALHQPTANEVRGDNLGRTAKEGGRESRKFRQRRQGLATCRASAV